MAGCEVSFVDDVRSDSSSDATATVGFDNINLDFRRLTPGDQKVKEWRRMFGNLRDRRSRCRSGQRNVGRLRKCSTGRGLSVSSGPVSGKDQQDAQLN